MEHYFPVLDNWTAEFCIIKWWSSLGDVVLSYSITFYGIMAVPREITLFSDSPVTRIDVTSPFRHEELSPKLELKDLVQPLRPADSKISALGPRDLFQDGQQIYELILTYYFTVHKTCEVTPTFPLLSSFLYENEYHSHLWMVFDSNDQYIFAGEAYPARYSRKLEKGDYKLVAQIRHDCQAMLEKVRDLNVAVYHRLEIPLSLDFYSSWCSAISIGEKKFKNLTISPGDTIPLYIAGLSEDSMPKNCEAGWYLSGQLILGKSEYAKVAQFPVKYVITSIARRSKRVIVARRDDQKSRSLGEAVRDVKIAWISRLNDPLADLLYKELVELFPDHIEIYFSRMKRLIGKNAFKHRKEIIQLADIIIGKVDRTSLLQFYGTKLDLSPEAAKSKTCRWARWLRSSVVTTIEIRFFEKRKAILLAALVEKGNAMADDILCATDDAPPSFKNGLSYPVPSARKLDTGVGTSVRATSSQSDITAPLDDTVLSDMFNDQAPDKLANDFGHICDNWDSEPSPTQPLNDAQQTPEPAASLDMVTVTKFTIADVDQIYREVVQLSDPFDPSVSHVPIFIELRTDSFLLQVIMFSAKLAVLHRHYCRALTFYYRILESRPSKKIEELCIEVSKWPK
ncbi:unnamed protein product [Soboliphyme baturini]|uniref:TPPII domain-containing protein n=1 Tax=Soboliphyme baturini TaxID=241478 RepID=A0A183J2K9_9BILA|nr:unnamed protein product [Soboliphyme baturini]